VKKQVEDDNYESLTDNSSLKSLDDEKEQGENYMDEKPNSFKRMVKFYK
jgi:hypothetical protein